MRRFIRVLAAMTALTPLASANASILTFDDLGLTNYSPISQDYGDSISSLNDGVGSYLEGNGFTPNVNVSYRTVNADGTVYEDHLEFWAAGYGDLTNIAFASNEGRYAEITLTADAGWLVTLNSFDLAGYSVPRPDQSLLVYSTDLTSPLVDYSPVTGVNPGHTTYTPSVTAQSLTIRFGTSWNVGIDNINFDQVLAGTSPVVPEPTSMALLGCGLLGGALARYRRRSAQA